MQYLIALFAILGWSSAQYIVPHQPIAYALQPQASAQVVHEVSSLAHRAVVENSIRESQLPAELIRSNNFYSNPKTADALAKDSWLTDKEMPVFDREAEKIPREQVFKIFKNAGFIHRRR
ncbi:hypothetical protein HA402_003211 [Bradysia odoriphaga]|uniref:uncharacterized protein LOC119075340 n=1 Tax=Bradysia coprophila TaxID=38358 RepID=UPI00187DA0D5|nr:uncharacterized protein LOC119075340 [Bradysia coprophila]XP_037037765.1 uncharacterized protein LOC119075340 [Bradysia coprophila]KAG4069770.1 hypothetical protein HA402_003211 [Bradysia odoriphaga]